MSQYVIRLTHTSDQCPTANSKSREMYVKGVPELPQLAQKLGLKFLAGPLVLSAEHEGIAVVEADNIETVHEFVLQSGLVQLNSVRVTLAQPIEEALKQMERIPPPLY